MPLPLAGEEREVQNSFHSKPKANKQPEQRDRITKQPMGWSAEMAWTGSELSELCSDEEKKERSVSTSLLISRVCS